MPSHTRWYHEEYLKKQTRRVAAGPIPWPDAPYTVAAEAMTLWLSICIGFMAGLGICKLLALFAPAVAHVVGAFAMFYATAFVYEKLRDSRLFTWLLKYYYDRYRRAASKSC